MNTYKRYIFLLYAFLQALFALAQKGNIEGKPALAYWTVGSGPDVVIVLHGGPGAGHSYLRPEWDSLSKAGKVVYYDQRGCGKSGKAACYGWREQVADLKRVITHFAKGTKVVLAGTSWGYELALLYVYTYPEDVKGMILSGVWGWIGFGKAKKDCDAYVLKGIKDTITFRSSFPMEGSLEYHYSKDRRSQEQNQFLMGSLFRSLDDAPALEQLKKIKVPALVAEGRNCEASPLKDQAQSLQGVLPQLQLFTVKDACHDPWYTHTKVFFDKCTVYLKNL